MTEARIEHLQRQIETQARCRTADWMVIARLRSRCDTLQGMVDWQRDRIAELEAQLTDSAIAERVFGGRHGQDQG